MVSERQIKDWYNQIHASKGKNGWRPYEASTIYLDYLNAKAGRKLLDIGCGTGYLLKGADKKGLETYGIDISDEAVKIAKKVSPNSKIIVGKGEDLKFPDKFFDYVTCIGALEHFLDIKKGVKEMLRVGREDASFCIVVPNINFLFWKIKGTKGTAQQDINENLFTLKQWRYILENNGLTIADIYHDKYIMKQIKIFTTIPNPLKILKNIILKLIWLSMPLNYTYQFVFICRKKY